MNDPYKTLGVAKTATEAEIKKAFGALAKKHHPDAHPGDEKAKQRFQELSAAYDVVGDKDKRAKFDAGEIDAAGNPRGFDPRAYGQQGGNPFGGGARGGSPFGFSRGQGGMGGGGEEAQGFSAEDIFSEILGGRGGRGGARPQSRVAKGEDFQIAVTVAVAESIQGGTRRVVLQNGEQIDVRIPAGLKEGQQIRVKGRGGAGRGGGPNGDILIQAHIAAHPFITRDGNDLRMDLPVTLKEAVLGGESSGTGAQRHGQPVHPARLQHGRGAAAEGQGRARHDTGRSVCAAGGGAARQARCRPHPVCRRLERGV